MSAEISPSSCPGCQLAIDEKKDDIVRFGGSCGHLAHFACASRAYILNPGKPCQQCSPLAPAKLWDHPLNFSLDDDTAASSGGGDTRRYRGLSSYLSDFLNSCVDTTDKTITSNLPVRTMRNMRVTPEVVIKKHGTGTLDFLFQNTEYSPDELREWGFTREMFLDAGLSPRHCVPTRTRNFFEIMIGSLENLLVVFSEDREKLARHGFSAKNLSWIGANAEALAKCGFKAKELVLMRFTPEELSEVLGLTKELMQSKFRFDYDSYFSLIQQDPTRWPEFEQAFGFVPPQPKSKEKKARSIIVGNSSSSSNSSEDEDDEEDEDDDDYASPYDFVRPIRIVNGKPVV